MKASVFIATSLDGFIARENGALDWLPGSGDGDELTNAESQSDDETGNDDGGFQEFFDSVDVLVMGKKTFDFVANSGQWYYGSKRVIVLSSTLSYIPEKLPKTVELKNSPVEELYNELRDSGVNHIYVDGGKTIQSFLKAGLIDQIIITRIPILIGTGISLFGELQRDIKLLHQETNSMPGGFVQSTYQVQKN